jgi:thioredoxin-dependent peroxiredoxin
MLGVLDDTNQDANGLPKTLQSVIILKLDQTIALMMTYSASTGTNVDEIFRVMDLLLLIGASNAPTPVDWKQGEEVIVKVPFRDADNDESFGKVSHHLTFVFIHTLVLTRTATIFSKFHQK